MDKQEEIVELNTQLQKNKENTEIFQRRLSEIRHEEDVYRGNLRVYIAGIDGLSDIGRGSVFTKIQSDAYSSIDELKKKVENAFQAEREQLRERLQSLDKEKDILTNRKKALEKEAE